MEAATARAARGRGVSLGDGALNRLRSDRGLAERYRAGDDGAFAVLHERHRPRMRAIAMAVLGSAEDAEDAVQDAFASTADALRLTTPRELSPWLARVTRNAAIDLARTRRPSVPAEPDLTRPDERSGRIQVRTDLADLLTALQAIPERQRSALVMRELTGLGYAEIGEVLDVDESAVRGLIARARVSLRSEREARELTCAAVRDQVAEQVDGRRRAAPVRRHLRGCADCRGFASGMRADARALRGMLPVAGVGIFAVLAGLRLTRPVIIGGFVAKGALATQAVQVAAVCAVCVVGAEGVREIARVAPSGPPPAAKAERVATRAAASPAAPSTTSATSPLQRVSPTPVSPTRAGPAGGVRRRANLVNPPPRAPGRPQRPLPGVIPLAGVGERDGRDDGRDTVEGPGRRIGLRGKDRGDRGEDDASWGEQAHDRPLAREDRTDRRVRRGSGGGQRPRAQSPAGERRDGPSGGGEDPPDDRGGAAPPGAPDPAGGDMGPDRGPAGPDDSGGP